MPHYSTLGTRKLGNVADVRGTAVYGQRNEELGTIDDVIFDHATGEIRYVVLISSAEQSHRKVLLAVGEIQSRDEQDRFYTDLSREQMEELPEFGRENTPQSREARMHEELKQCWSSGAVLYNKCTGHTITPPDDQVQGARTELLSEEAKASLTRDFTPQKVGKEDALFGVGPSNSSKVTLEPQKPSSAGMEETARLDQQARTEDQSASSDYGRRWIAFQQRLREEREAIVGGCSLCGTQDKAA
jgi:sporulation protein YlmC with PRC-barrel domain